MVASEDNAICKDQVREAGEIHVSLIKTSGLVRRLRVRLHSNMPKGGAIYNEAYVNIQGSDDHWFITINVREPEKPSRLGRL